MENDKRKTILIVDDDEDYCDVTRTRLEKEGYQVSYVLDGNDALTLLQESSNPDLIILDIDMPEQNGIAMLINLNTKVRNKPAGDKQRVPVIVATGLEDVSIEEIAKQNDADDFLRKPYNYTELIEKVKRLTKKSTS
jgi:two-component system, sensor histidine kinase and response regulator